MFQLYQNLKGNSIKAQKYKDKLIAIAAPTVSFFIQGKITIFTIQQQTLI